MNAETATNEPKVLVLMGSENDWGTMQSVGKALDELGVPWEAHVSSAHRTPQRTAELVRGARDRGIRVVICGAGMAAHLAGVAAAETTLPVIAVPIAAGALAGVDALLAMAQMPPGVPVATVAVNGARNAGILAAQMIALAEPELAARIDEARERMREKVEAADASLQERIRR